VLLGATTGAIRRYCEAKQDPLFDTTTDTTTDSKSKHKQLLLRSLLPVAFPGI
jgi:hypothetical protein